MMTISVKMNGHEIANAMVFNRSNCASLSDYVFYAESIESPVTGKPHMVTEGRILNHPREQSAWALVAEVAAHIANAENAPDKELPISINGVTK